MCKRCPRFGFIKTPVQVGTAETKEVGGLPWGWRGHEGKTERLMTDEETGKAWVKMISYEFANFRTARSLLTGMVEHRLDVVGIVLDLVIPGECLGNQHKLIEHMALYGVAFRGKEAIAFKELMAIWLKNLQDAKHVAEVTEQLGWVTKDDAIVGFSCGRTTFYADGRVRDDVRTAKEFTAIGKYYEPVGTYKKWQEVAEFITTQDNPAFTAILASAFAAPILRFTGISGGTLSIVSAESGVGKTSALKMSQAVWGSPTHGVNAIDDTPKSVARKLGYLNNLPAYWDELRGKEAVEEFVRLVFQIAQGKEKTRLTQQAAMQEIHTWETMLIVASNDSIFESMARHSTGSDAGVARTFEVTVQPSTDKVNVSELAVLFGQLNQNYGHAGRVYAQYLARHAPEVEARVQHIRTKLGVALKEDPAERFWFSMMAAIVVGAEIAHDLEIAKINTKTLIRFLGGNLNHLRGRGNRSLAAFEPEEIVSSYIQQHQDKVLLVDVFPLPRANTRGYHPEILITPRSEKIICHQSRDDDLVRFSRSDFVRWLEARGLPSGRIVQTLKTKMGATEKRAKLGIGTKYEIPIAQYLLEVPLTHSKPLDEVVK
jgi:hypothetical protein